MENLKTETINGVEMKIVEARVLLAVPVEVSLDSVKANVKEGVLFMIEEHLFTNEETREVSDADYFIDNVELLKVSCENYTKGVSDD